MCSSALASRDEQIRELRAANAAFTRRYMEVAGERDLALLEAGRLRDALTRLSISAGQALYPEGGKVAPVKP